MAARALRQELISELRAELDDVRSLAGIAIGAAVSGAS